MKKILIAEMKSIFGSDTKRINHSLAVLKIAEQINKSFHADESVVTAAAVLHDIGIQKAEKVHNSNAGKYQQIEGPPIAEAILGKYNYTSNKIKLICDIIANHHTAKDKKTVATKEFQVIWDADWIINFKEIYPDINNQKKSELIETIFKTDIGRKIAKQQLSE